MTLRVLALLAISCLVSGCVGSGSDRLPDLNEMIPQQPKPAGPIVELANGRFNGELWQMFGYLTADGMCLGLESTGGGAAIGCGPMPDGTQPMNLGTQGSGNVAYLTGQLRADVTRVVVEFDGGTSLLTPFAPPAGSALPGRYVVLPYRLSDHAISATAFDAADRKIAVQGLPASDAPTKGQ